MALLFDTIKNFFQTYGLERKYWVAFSGGLDSRVLLQLCAEYKKDFPLKIAAIHINHGLSPNAKQWQKQTALICANLHIDYIVKKIDLSSHLLKGKSPEAIAREYRYQQFKDHLLKDDFILTAHHQDDQAETLLLQLFRGAGPKGLAAMPSIKSLGRGFHARPLLNFSRSDLKKYAEAHQLSWTEDESNTDTQFSRNFIRHDVLKPLKKRWPSITKTLARVATQCAETQSLLEKFIDVNRFKNKVTNTLSTKKLLKLDGDHQRQVMRAWIASENVIVPTALKMQQIQKQLLFARGDKVPEVSWGKVSCRRYRDEIYLMNQLPSHDPEQAFSWDFKNPLVLPNIGTLTAIGSVGEGLRSDIKSVTVRFRRGGERCLLPGRECHHDLKKLFQQWHVPPWERDRIPLLFFNEILIAIVGYYLDERFSARENESSWMVSYFRSKVPTDERFLRRR